VHRKIVVSKPQSTVI